MASSQMAFAGGFEQPKRGGGRRAKKLTQKQAEAIMYGPSRAGHDARTAKELAEYAAFVEAHTGRGRVVAPAAMTQAWVLPSSLPPAKPRKPRKKAAAKGRGKAASKSKAARKRKPRARKYDSRVRAYDKIVLAKAAAAFSASSRKPAKKPAKKKRARPLRRGKLRSFMAASGGKVPWTTPYNAFGPLPERRRGPHRRATLRWGESRGGLPGTRNPMGGQYTGAGIVALSALAGFVGPALAAAGLGKDVSQQIMIRRGSGVLLALAGLLAIKKGQQAVGTGLIAGGALAVAGNEVMGKSVNALLTAKAKLSPPTLSAVQRGGQYLVGQRTMDGVAVDGRLLHGQRGVPAPSSAREHVLRTIPRNPYP